MESRDISFCLGQGLEETERTTESCLQVMINKVVPVAGDEGLPGGHASTVEQARRPEYKPCPVTYKGPVESYAERVGDWLMWEVRIGLDLSRTAC